MELIRHDASSSFEAWLTNAFLLDLQHMSLLHPSMSLKDIIIDKYTGKKARKKVISHFNYVQNYENLF